MIDVPPLLGLLEHLVLLFALFGLPLGVIGAVVGFLIFKDFQRATDTTTPEERLAQARAQHQLALEGVEEQHRVALEHAKHQRELQLYAANREALRQLDMLIARYAQKGMYADLRAACDAALRIDPEHTNARRYLGELDAAVLA